MTIAIYEINHNTTAEDWTLCCNCGSDEAWWVETFDGINFFYCDGCGETTEIPVVVDDSEEAIE